MNRIYRATVMHQRLSGPSYQFRYPVFTLLLDIDRLEETAQSSRWLSYNRRNLLSFHDRDHGPRDGTALRPWVNDLLQHQGLPLPERVMLLSMPRLLGYVFNPLSLYYCLDTSGRPIAVIAEVKNTFGEQHAYLLPAEGRQWPVRAETTKHFHVSPFIGMECRYRFRLSAPGERLAVVIEQEEADRPVLIATETGRALPFTDSGLLGCVARLPFMTFKVMVMIHWQALKLWLRGAPVHTHPVHQEPQEVPK